MLVLRIQKTSGLHSILVTLAPRVASIKLSRPKPDVQSYTSGSAVCLPSALQRGSFLLSECARVRKSFERKLVESLGREGDSSVMPSLESDRRIESSSGLGRHASKCFCSALEVPC